MISSCSLRFVSPRPQCSLRLRLWKHWGSRGSKTRSWQNSLFPLRPVIAIANSLTRVFLLHFLFFSDPWVKANLHPVCFGAKANNYGSFHVPSSGKIAAVKLIHLSGYVSCAVSGISYWSFWGCGNKSPIGNHVSLAITTSSNALLMPPYVLFTYGNGRWSELNGYNSFSDEIILPRFSPYSVYSGQELRLWYGEDLVGYTEHDNGGWVCCNVYVLYVY